ncbi:MAG TPA: QueT transporter family protein [bacterium]|nr:QueT transporter family protein [bacterium]
MIDRVALQHRAASSAAAPRGRGPAHRVAEGAVIAAAYAALTIYLAPVAYGPYQLRISEILKPLVIWEPQLIPAFVVGNLLSNIGSPYVGPWELVWMPFANLIGGWLCWRLGRRSAYLGAAAYAIVIAAAVAVMLSVILHASLRALFPPLLVSEVLLIVLGVPVMRPVHAALRRVFKDPTTR